MTAGKTANLRVRCYGSILYIQYKGLVRLQGTLNLTVMNGSGKDRYSSNWEKLSKRLRLLYPCAICGETDFLKKEAHHIDGNKKNGTIKNAIVLCSVCHGKVHSGTYKIPETFKGYNIIHVSKIKTYR